MRLFSRTTISYYGNSDANFDPVADELLRNGTTIMAVLMNCHLIVALVTDIVKVELYVHNVIANITISSKLSGNPLSRWTESGSRSDFLNFNLLY